MGGLNFGGSKLIEICWWVKTFVVKTFGGLKFWRSKFLGAKLWWDKIFPNVFVCLNSLFLTQRRLIEKIYKLIFKNK